MSIDWLNTYYIHDGRRNGQFGWEGMTFEDLNKIRENPYRVIQAGDTLSAIIFPLKLIARLDRNTRARIGGPGPEGQIAFGPIPAGENGMMLTVNQNGKQIQETIVFNIRMTEMRR